MAPRILKRGKRIHMVYWICLLERHEESGDELGLRHRGDDEVILIAGGYALQRLLPNVSSGP